MNAVGRDVFRLLWRADAMGRLRMIVPLATFAAIAIAGFAMTSAGRPAMSVQIALAPAVMLTMFTILSRQERHEARAYLQSLPIAPSTLAPAEALIDLLAPLIMSALAIKFIPGGVAMAPTLFLASLWGMAWGNGVPSWSGNLAAVVTFALLAAMLNTLSPVATAVACLGPLVWMLREDRDEDEGAPVRNPIAVTPEQQAAQAPSLPLLRSRLLLATAVGPGANLFVILWSGLMTWFAVAQSPSSSDMAFMPLFMVVGIAVATGARIAGPVREFMLVRPISRRRYLLAPIALTLTVMLMPIAAELGRAHQLNDVQLDAKIRHTALYSSAGGGAPRGDVLARWERRYADALAHELSLPALPAGALVRNPEPDVYLPWVPSPTLRTAVRAAWQTRQVRFLLLGLIVFLFAFPRPATGEPAGGAAQRSGWRWAWAALGVPLLLVQHHPECLIFPTWPLLLLLPVAAVRFWWIAVSDDAV